MVSRIDLLDTRGREEDLAVPEYQLKSGNYPSDITTVKELKGSSRLRITVEV